MRIGQSQKTSVFVDFLATRLFHKELGEQTLEIGCTTTLIAARRSVSSGYARGQRVLTGRNAKQALSSVGSGLYTTSSMDWRDNSAKSTTLPIKPTTSTYRSCVTS